MTNLDNTFVERAQAKLEQAEARIDLLQAKAREAKADYRVKIQQEIDDLQERRKSLKSRMTKMKEAGEDASGDLLSGAEAAWDALSQAIQRASSRFN